MRNKRKFYIISITVAALLLALIALQIYWVQNAYQLRKVQYQEKMNRVLDKVAGYTEELLSFYLYGRSYIKPGEGVMILKTDYASQTITDTVSLFNAFAYNNADNDTCFYATPISYYDRLTQVDVALKFTYQQSQTSVNASEKNAALRTMNIDNFRTSLEDPADVTKRLKKTKLDSFIHATLQQEGIAGKYQYRFRQQNENSTTYVVGDTLLTPDSWFTREIFATIPFVKPYEISMYVANSEQWMGCSLLSALAISFLITLLLILAFIYFVYTVLRQKKLSEMKVDFINNMTHEFMTPVTNITLALETLEKNYDSEVLQIIAAENDLLKVNINKVLQVAALEKDSYLLELSEVDIHEILKRVARTFSSQIAEKQGIFVFKMQAARKTVMADETHIINLFYNIVDNSIKYASNRPLEINIATENIKGKLQLQISDNGRGMTGEVQQLIFEKFYRAQTGNLHDVKGFGLGLTYVKSIADAHGIAIDVDSKADVGTVFNLWFTYL